MGHSYGDAFDALWVCLWWRWQKVQRLSAALFLCTGQMCRSKIAGWFVAENLGILIVHLMGGTGRRTMSVELSFNAEATSYVHRADQGNYFTMCMEAREERRARLCCVTLWSGIPNHGVVKIQPKGSICLQARWLSSRLGSINMKIAVCHRRRWHTRVFNSPFCNLGVS